MQVGNGAVHGIVEQGAFAWGLSRQGAVPLDPALDMLHDIKPASEHVIVGADPVNLGDGKSRLPKRRHHPRLPIDRVSALHRRAGGLAPHDIGALRRDELKRGV